MTSRAAWAVLVASLTLVGACSSTSDEDDDLGAGDHDPAPAARTTGSQPDLLLTQDLPEGAAPRVPYLVGKPLGRAPWKMVRPAGDSLVLHVIPGQFAPLGDGLVTLVTGEASNVYVLGRDGRSVRSQIYTSSTRLVVGGRGRIVGWVALGRENPATGAIPAFPTLWFAGGGHRRLPAGPADETLVGVQGAGCARHHARCRAVVSTGGRTFVIKHAGRALLTSRPAVDVRADLATISGRNSRRSCSAMWSRTGRRLWRDCRHAAVSFSPSGRHVLATDGYGTTVASRRLFVLDDHDRVEAAFRAPRGVDVTSATWEDDRHLLVRLSRDWTTSYVVRVSVGGDAELVFASRGHIRSLVSYELPAG